MLDLIKLPERCMRCELPAQIVLTQYQHGNKYKCGPASDVFKADSYGNVKRPLEEQNDTRFIRFDSYCADHYMAKADSEREWREANPLEYLAQTRRYGAGHHA
jgi:hypothetical protein